MKINISKTEAENQIENFFRNIKSKTPKKIKKIKRLAMNKKISLKDKRKLFCKYCFKPYSVKDKIRIKNKMKIIECSGCGGVSRWGIGK